MVVLDSSAVIAVLKQEAGFALIAGQISDGCISAVNVQEIVKKLLDAGVPEAVIREMIGNLGVTIIPHDVEDAFLAASLAPATRRFGKGLGDRSCMALAIRLGAPAITTDRMWAELDIPGLEVILAR